MLACAVGVLLLVRALARATGGDERLAMAVVALAPLGVPRDLDDPDGVRAKFLALVADQLRSAGLEIVPPTYTAAVFDEKAAQAGGIYDPYTGKPDEAKLKAAHAAAYAELGAKFKADAVLYSDIRVVTAALDHDKAIWDGTSEGAGKGGVWKMLLSASSSGRIPALSLAVRLRNMEDKDLYVNAGGIQVLVNVGMGGKAERVPRAELFANEERNVNAVRLALEPLLTPKKAD
jgi:hypothetical protein